MSIILYGMPYIPLRYPYLFQRRKQHFARRTRICRGVETSVIERAKRFLRRIQTSVSELVSRFLASLDDHAEDSMPIVSRLRGVLPPEVSTDEHQAHLESRHR